MGTPERIARRITGLLDAAGMVQSGYEPSNLLESIQEWINNNPLTTGCGMLVHEEKYSDGTSIYWIFY